MYCLAVWLLNDSKYMILLVSLYNSLLCITSKKEYLSPFRTLENRSSQSLRVVSKAAWQVTAEPECKSRTACLQSLAPVPAIPAQTPQCWRPIPECLLYTVSFYLSVSQWKLSPPSPNSSKTGVIIFWSKCT